MICKRCTSLQKLIHAGHIIAHVKCPLCSNDKFDMTIKKQKLTNFKSIKKEAYKHRKFTPQKQKISQLHYDRLYNKYHESLGIDAKKKWLNNFS